MERYLQPVGVLRQQRLRRQSAFEVLLRHPTSKLDTQINARTSIAATSSSTSIAPGNQENTNNGPSTGAKAGIGAACGAVGLAALIGIIVWFLWRKGRATKVDAKARWQQEQQQEQQQQMLQTQKSSPPYGHASPQYGGGAYCNAPLATLNTSLPQEMAAQSPAELPPMETVRGELVADVPHENRK
ncbi:hypothetical protein LTR59_012952 [Friedmanniomyces endolithicus]|nr:hypothetical protein LTR94_014242 [Friedmanniomyces endolithicus]KAK0780099.1 hypothetical protein LTR59_012952 [Friedmanniomyces endolithicus]KAK0834326.1 hypothetical protein LTR03_014388 [Friedmanniomyces endolithicus]